MTEPNFEKLNAYGTVISHPLRVQFLTLAADGPISPVGATRIIQGATLGTVAYHCNTLVRYGCLKVATSRRRRGTVEHFFKLTPRGAAVLRLIAVLSEEEDWR